jgi:hypothetical protein
LAFGDCLAAFLLAKLWDDPETSTSLLFRKAIVNHREAEVICYAFFVALHSQALRRLISACSPRTDDPSASGLQSVAGDIWDRGGVVAAVCHGPVLLPRVIDSKTGKSIIAGKTVTGFSLEGEMIFRILEKLKSDKVLTVVEAVSRVGADYSSPMGPFDDYSITAGRVTTGTNPASARSAAERAVKVFELII